MAELGLAIKGTGDEGVTIWCPCGRSYWLMMVIDGKDTMPSLDVIG